ncbi:uncharacterized protein EHS24_009226 [Apiotrichum porosum]|uniref:Uncharacterized protein n=1 Tax=Apiotrichum porosum TaxID=105984 RepID=A0A427XP90_9TREE|nr:uncharacterized protein EHS24_009226 [Apiotrichum porosum]RSH80642.1 hypothetical protein EHS24_009226 [Apiotrichum porosum]
MHYTIEDEWRQSASQLDDDFSRDCLLGAECLANVDADDCNDDELPAPRPSRPSRPSTIFSVALTKPKTKPPPAPHFRRQSMAPSTVTRTVTPAQADDIEPKTEFTFWPPTRARSAPAPASSEPPSRSESPASTSTAEPASASTSTSTCSTAASTSEHASEPAPKAVPVAAFYDSSPLDFPSAHTHEIASSPETSITAALKGLPRPGPPIRKSTLVVQPPEALRASWWSSSSGHSASSLVSGASGSTGTSGTSGTYTTTREWIGDQHHTDDAESVLTAGTRPSSVAAMSRAGSRSVSASTMATDDSTLESRSLRSLDTLDSFVNAYTDRGYDERSESESDDEDGDGDGDGDVSMGWTGVTQVQAQNHALAQAQAVVPASTVMTPSKIVPAPNASAPSTPKAKAQPSKLQAKTPVKTPVAAPLKTPAQTPTRTPTRTSAKTPVQTPVKTPVKTPTKTRTPIKSLFLNAIIAPKNPTPANPPLNRPASTTPTRTTQDTRHAPSNASSASSTAPSPLSTSTTAPQPRLKPRNAGHRSTFSLPLFAISERGEKATAAVKPSPGPGPGPSHGPRARASVHFHVPAATPAPASVTAPATPVAVMGGPRRPAPPPPVSAPSPIPRPNGHARAKSMASVADEKTVARWPWGASRKAAAAAGK